MERPYISDYWPKLAARSDSAWNDAVALQSILAELLFRKRSGAQDLRKKVAQRLVELSREDFFWPTTAILPSSQALSGDHFWYTQGMLSFMGYRVGQSGVPAANRRDILNYVYNETLPKVGSPALMEEWARPKTGNRLRKLANCLASFSRNAKRNLFADMSVAIEDWESDLAYLKVKFYDGRYDFSWPDCT